MTSSTRERTVNMHNGTAMEQMLFKYKAQGRLISMKNSLLTHFSSYNPYILYTMVGDENIALSTFIYFHVLYDAKPNTSMV